MTPLGKRLFISVLLTPVAFAVGLVVYFVPLMLAGMAMASQGGRVSPTVGMIWLIVAVGGTVAGSWALVWAMVKD
jgi:hypothetical protein